MSCVTALNLTAKIATTCVIRSRSQVRVLSPFAKVHASFCYEENIPFEQDQGCCELLWLALTSWQNSKPTLSAECKRIGREFSYRCGPLTQLCISKANFLYFSNNCISLVQSLCLSIHVCYPSRTHMLVCNALHLNDCFFLPAGAAWAGALQGCAAEARESERYHWSVDTLCSSSCSVRPVVCVI